MALSRLFGKSKKEPSSPSGSQGLHSFFQGRGVIEELHAKHIETFMPFTPWYFGNLNLKTLEKPMVRRRGGGIMVSLSIQKLPPFSGYFVNFPSVTCQLAMLLLSNSCYFLTSSPLHLKIRLWVYS